jgi:hypothetical protein
VPAAGAGFAEEKRPTTDYTDFTDYRKRAGAANRVVVSDGSKQRAIMPTDESEEKFEQKEAKVTKEIGIGCW